MDPIELIPTRFFDKLPHGVYLKDLQLNYQYANPKALQGAGFCAKEFVGRNDFDMPWGASAQSCIDYDRDILNGYHYTKISLCHQTSSQKQFIHDQKQAVYDNEGNILGILGHFTTVPLKLFNLLNMLEQLPSNSYKLCQYLDNYTASQKKQYQLTSKESLCLFYFLHGMSAKQSGAALYLSPKTVEHHIANIKQKWQCYNKQDLFSKAYELGCMDVIPMDVLALLNKKHTETS